MNRMHMKFILAVLIVIAPAHAEIFELPPEGHDVVGAVSTIVSRQEDTLVDIARRHGLDYEDIVRANPNVNIWLPGNGTEIVLPTRYVLPAGPRDGVVLNLAEYRLYYYPEPVNGEPAYVMTYPIIIGRMDWETPLGLTTVISKVRNPTWYPPQSVRDEHAADGKSLPRIVPPGPKNPLGKYAMRLGIPGYLIHGTNRPAGVGMRVTHGCVRMFPEDIDFLFGHIDVNTNVRIVNEPVKIGWHGDELIMEVHPVLKVETLLAESDVQPDDDVDTVARDPLTMVTEQFITVTGDLAGKLDWYLAEDIVGRSDGIPVAVGQSIKNAAASAAPE